MSPLPTSCRNVIQVAPPAEPQLVIVSAILFSPEEGELTEINHFRLSNAANASCIGIQKNRDLSLLAVDRRQRFLKE
jgi:hypothetical protein